MKKMFIAVVANVMLFCSFGLNAQNAAQVVETEEEYVTYPYSDPNPIPEFGKVYPYFRYDGYTANATKTKHKVVVLENDYLRIKVFPEIGGKIWSVVDKSCGKEMFYDNKVVKFRDIALRGAWTSGGIEFNYGVIGHAPSCSFPVEYKVERKDDGSVSCWISDLDLLTRSRWIVEICLPADKGWFTTKSFWHNGNSGSQPYYNWVNTGVDASDDLQLIYPGTYSVAHEGETIPWPMDAARGKNLSRWAENDFEGAKSYHIAGAAVPYFGAYWAKNDFGMMHIAARDEKVGKKFFTWALSDEGDIWKELLTDANGQYLEVQSGRLFNQNTERSSETPFKQFYFAPYATDVWTEYWFPFKNTGGVANASLYGVINVAEKGNVLTFSLSPLQEVADTLKVYDDGGGLLASHAINLSVATPCLANVRIPDGKRAHKMMLCNSEIWSREDKTMNRPQRTEIFAENSAYASYLLGRDLSGMRLYAQAEEKIREALALCPHFIPALVEMSRLHYRHFAYDSAYFYARRALSIDTYDADANFEYGRAALRVGKRTDALDGFEIAALTTPLRSAAYTELGKIYFSEKDYEKSAEYARKSLINNSFNIEGLQLLYLYYRKKQDAVSAEEIARRITALNPFNLMLLYEKCAPDMKFFAENIHSEMPVQSFLELAIRYYALGEKEKSRAILKAAPANAEVAYWLAFIHKDTPDEAVFLQKADAESAYFVFPFREESHEMLKWAVEKSNSWKPAYYMALLQASANNDVRNMLDMLSEKPDFPPFYALRAAISGNDAGKERDLRRAVSLAPDEWRYTHRLTNHYNEKGEYAKALQTVKTFYGRHANHFQTAFLYMRTLTYNRQYEEAEKTLNSIHVLPFEGERGGRVIYREIKMMLTVQALAGGKTKEAKRKLAEAFLWPHRLGAGKPYDEMIDTRLEDWMGAMIVIKSKNHTDRNLYLTKVANSTHPVNNSSALLQCLALWQIGEQQKANDLFDKWFSLQRNSNLREWGERFYKNNRDKEYPFVIEEMTELIGFISGNRDRRLF